MKREPFNIEGDCWCHLHGNPSIQQLNTMGHTEQCTIARKAWRLSHDHLARIDRQRRSDEDAGRRLRLGEPQ